MDVMTLAYDDTLVRMDNSVIEVFRRQVIGSQRTPLVWAGVQLKPKKGDQIQVNIGTLIEATGPFYGDGIISNGVFNFSVPTSEEPRLREFFDEAARRATATGRTGSSMAIGGIELAGESESLGLRVDLGAEGGELLAELLEL